MPSAVQIKAAKIPWIKLQTKLRGMIMYANCRIYKQYSKTVQNIARLSLPKRFRRGGTKKLAKEFEK